MSFWLGFLIGIPIGAAALYLYTLAYAYWEKAR
jgi:hypothetical protein